jgi:hypothetical protein
MRGLASWRVDKRWDTNGALTKRTLSVVVRQCKGSVQGVRTDPRCRTLRGVGPFGNGASQEPNSWNITISLCQKKSSRSPRGVVGVDPARGFVYADVHVPCGDAAHYPWWWHGSRLGDATARGQEGW